MSKKTPQKRKSRVPSEDSSLSGCSEVADLINSPQFSPVSVGRSMRGSPGGQLTGLPRKVKDSCVDWHNYIADWDSLNSKGMQIISEIANVKLQASGEVTQEEVRTPDISSVLPPKLEDLCVQLQSVHSSMEKLVKKFTQLTSALKGAAVLDESMQDRSLGESSCQPPLFNTWSTEDFYESSQTLLRMYEQELEVKKCILENVAHSPNRDTLMMYSAMWLHQAYIETRAEKLIHGMLLETGLR